MNSEVINSKWESFERLDFKFKGREAILVLPEIRSAKPDGKGRLALYAEYFGAFADSSGVIQLIRRGYHLAYLQNANRWGTDDDQRVKREFIDYISEKYNLSKRFVPVGMSAGAVCAISFAYLYPEYVSVLYIDAPAINLLHCPLGLENPNASEEVKAEFLNALGMTAKEMLSYRLHPMDKLGVLTDNNIPVIMLYGENDDVVPYEEHGKIVVDYYAKRGRSDLLKVIGKPNCGHHPHGLPDNPEVIANFIAENDAK